MRKNIKITNPLEGPGWTSRQRAKRYVVHGAAEWVEFGSSIRFLRAETHCEASIKRSTADCGYDVAANTGMATATELANLPMVAVGKFLGFGRRKGASRSAFAGHA